MSLDEGPAAGHHRRVLVVEDETDVRESAAALLLHSGFEVVEAADGATALGLLAQPGLRFEAVLLDMRLPDMSGEEIARLAPTLQPGLPVIVCSALTESESTPHTAWVQKPYEPLGLVALVTELARFGDRRPRPIPRSPETPPPSIRG
jgi:CheY-like chemotaxis protein